MKGGRGSEKQKARQERREERGKGRGRRGRENGKQTSGMKSRGGKGRERAFMPERITSDSMSIARLSRRLRSMIRATSTAASPGLPGSNSWEAIGLNSTRN